MFTLNSHVQLVYLNKNIKQKSQKNLEFQISKLQILINGMFLL